VLSEAPDFCRRFVLYSFAKHNYVEIVRISFFEAASHIAVLPKRVFTFLLITTYVAPDFWFSVLLSNEIELGNNIFFECYFFPNFKLRRSRSMIIYSKLFLFEMS